MKKRILLIALAILLIAAIPVAAFAVSAAGNKVQNVSTGDVYDSLDSAVSSAREGDTLKLLDNVSVSSPVKITKGLTIDGNGKTVSNTGGGEAFNIAAAVTVKNISVSSTTGGGFTVDTNGELTLNGSTVDVKGSSGKANALYMAGSAPRADVYTSTLKGSTQAVGSEASGATVNIHSGHFEAKDNVTGVRLFQMYGANSTWNFYGGTFVAQRGYVFNCSVDGSTVNVYGGSFYDTGANESFWIFKYTASANFYGGYFYSPNLNYTVTNEHSPKINFYGGTFVNKTGLPMSANTTAQKTIYGGSYLNSTYGVQMDPLTPVPVRIDGASVRLAATSSGIRFTSYVPARTIAAIKAMADTGSEISYGTVILPTDKLDAEIITFDYLKSKGYVEGVDYVDVPAEKGLSADGEGNVTFNAAMINIKAKNYGREFSAAAYIKYTVNGVTCYAFSVYDDGDSRSIKDVAHRALAVNDTSGKYTESQVAVLEHYASEKNTDNTYTTVNVLTLNILTHEADHGGNTTRYKLYGNQTVADYDFAPRLEYAKAMVAYANPDVILFQEFSGPRWWGTVMNLKPVSGRSGIYTSEHFPGYIWVNHQNRRGVLYENNTDGNPFGAHNFVLYKADKFDLIESGTRFVSESGERAIPGSWYDNGGGVGGSGLYDDLGDYTWVVLQDKETGLRSIYASIHTYNGSIQRHAYMLDNLQCVTEFLQKKSTEYGGIPATIGGDFNLNYRDPVQYFTYDHMVEVANFVDSKVLGSNSGTARVFGNAIPGTNGGSAHGSRIDYIFTNGGEPYAYEVLNGMFVKTSGGYEYDPYCPLDGTGYDVSDHLPVIAKIIIGEGYKYQTADKSNYFRNDGTKDDTVVTDSSAASVTAGKVTFTTTDILKYITLGEKLTADIVKDSAKGNVLRVMATDETNRVSMEIDYKALLGTVDLSKYSTITLTYRTDYTLSGCKVKFGCAQYANGLSLLGTLTEMSSSDGWTTLTLDVSSLSYALRIVGIYGALEATGLVNGDAIYIASIELK
ncbi:MAG: endonuclease/exonuclease/phosphatase family protein [Clostridia bacterium]|nr:endonuclease/exonuclease/phosphatase family protein [Clostridia bacterium]